MTPVVECWPCIQRPEFKLYYTKKKERKGKEVYLIVFEAKRTAWCQFL
jgi:hypothetical protein